MSEERKESRYMEELDRWTRSTIINPLEAAVDAEIDEGTAKAVCKAIREKTLESFRNGLKAKSRPQLGGERRPMSYGRRVQNYPVRASV